MPTLVRYRPMFGYKDLREWNEEMERQDTMYYIDVQFFEKSRYTGDYKEKDGDTVHFQTDDLADAKKEYEYLKGLHSGELVQIKLMKAFGVYKRNLEYEPMQEYSTLKKEKSAQSRAAQKYAKANTVSKSLTFNKKTDAKYIERINQLDEPFITYIRRLMDDEMSGR